MARACQFAITKALPYIFTSFGYGTWFFFAGWMLLATLWSYFLLPETKGLTVDQMDDVLYVPLSPVPQIFARTHQLTCVFYSGYKRNEPRHGYDEPPYPQSDVKQADRQSEHVSEHSEEPV